MHAATTSLNARPTVRRQILTRTYDLTIYLPFMEGYSPHSPFPLLLAWQSYLPAVHMRLFP